MLVFDLFFGSAIPGRDDLSYRQAFGLTGMRAGLVGRPRAKNDPDTGRPIGRLVSEKEWQAFLNDTVTVNLPNGYTVLNAVGAWMNPITHKTIHEASRVVVAALPESRDSLSAINRIRSEYQVRFHQQLVGMAVMPACGSF